MKESTGNTMAEKATIPVAIETPPPFRAKVGTYITQTFDAKITYRGIDLYHVKDGFSGRGDRDDWIADLAGVGFTVSNGRGRGFSDGRLGWGWNGDMTFAEAFEYELDLSLRSARYYRDKKLIELGGLVATIAKLETAANLP